MQKLVDRHVRQKGTTSEEKLTEDDDEERPENEGNRTSNIPRRPEEEGEYVAEVDDIAEEKYFHADLGKYEQMKDWQRHEAYVNEHREYMPKKLYSDIRGMFIALWNDLAEDVSRFNEKGDTIRLEMANHLLLLAPRWILDTKGFKCDTRTGRRKYHKAVQNRIARMRGHEYHRRLCIS